MFKRFWLKLYIKAYKYINKKDYILVDKRELQAKSLALKIICHPQSDLRMCPETFKKYVDNPYLNASIIFEENSIDFFDDHLHTIYFCRKTYSSIIQVFNKHSAADKKQLDIKIRTSVRSSFEDMSENISKKI